MRDARLRSEWTNTSFVFYVSDLWMAVLTSTACFVSSHDLLKRRWITNVSPLVKQDFMSENEFASQQFYLKRQFFFSFIHDLITAFLFIISTSLYGSCSKSAPLNWRALRSCAVSGCARCAVDARGTEDRTPHRCPVMMHWGWWRERTPLWGTFRQEIGTASTFLSPGCWLYSPVFSSLRL